MTPNSRPVGDQSSVTATVEWPVRAVSANTSVSVASMQTLESLTTKPALYVLPPRTMAACSSMDCEPNTNDKPPQRAKATERSIPDTDCIKALVTGTLIVRGERRAD